MVFRITGGHVDISVVTIRHGHYSGGIVNFERATLTLGDSVVKDNSAHPGPLAGVAAPGGGVKNSGTLILNRTTISDNYADIGGGIENQGILSLFSSTVSNNASDRGGGIYNSGTLTVTNSTFRGNRARFDAGGIHNSDTLTMTSSTVSDNTAGLSGGGIYDCGSTLVLSSTIITNNAGDDCFGNITSLGHNLDSDGTCGFSATGDLSDTDPLLGPLRDNGGPTMTHMLILGSPAIDAGDDGVLHPPLSLVTDQRGEPRLQGLHVDIGAYEAAVILGDINHDGRVNATDVRIIAHNLGTSPPANPAADLNGDGKVDIRDLGVVAMNLGRMAP